MERFLSQCAAYILEKHPSGLEDVCLVFPNRRAGVFFSSYLRKLLPHAVIGPEVTTVKALISGYSALHQGEKLQLISVLYDIFRKHTQTKETFDDFYFWGEVLLADFSDIDMYLADAQDLFTNVADLKEIEGLFDYLTDEQKAALGRFWGSLVFSDPKANHEKFLFIWKKLFPVYRDFKAALRKQGTGYGGMIFRSVVERLEGEAPELPFSRYYIIGLNALNRCETAFFEYLQQEGKAEFLWDFDRFYLEDEKNEAGRFMRGNLVKFPPPPGFLLPGNAFEQKKNVRLVAVSSNYGQAQEIPRFLNEHRDSFQNVFDNTAVVLADESILFPALGAIPEDFGAVNVTMGYPVKHSVVYGFLVLLLRLLKNRKTDERNRTVVFYRYITDILNHPLLGHVEPEKCRDFLSTIKKENRITLLPESIDFSPLHQRIFSLPGEVNDYGAYFLDILGRLYRLVKEQDPENQLLPELIYSVYQAIEKLNSVIARVQREEDREITEAVFFQLFHQYLGQVSVAFEGEPLSGMQVMGILETRCLDFENLIILGLNENQWPRTYTAPSFIPYNVRKAFGLPGIDEQDAMYAYYFYRLMQRAKNVSATYSTLKKGISTGEMSRYGFQLLYDSSLRLQMKNLDFAFSSTPESPVSVKGSPGIQKLLTDKYTQAKALSPSAINTFLQCRLRFYFRHILGLPEPDEMKDEIDSPAFGNIFHEAMERLYAPFRGKRVERSDLERLRKNPSLVEKEIYRAIAKHYFKQDPPGERAAKLEGKTVLIFENTKTFVNRLLEIDTELAPFEVVALEKDYRTRLMVPVNGRKIPVLVGGKIDRVDRVNGVLRVLDYKTGNVDSLNFKDTAELFVPDLEKPKKEILQALVYCLVLKANMGGENEFRPVIYSLRDLFNEKFDPEIKYHQQPVSFRELEQPFTERLEELVAEILSAGTGFHQTPHEKVCTYCPYAKICRRY